MMRSLLRAVAGVGALLAASVLATACPFCSSSGTTLTKDVNQSAFVVYGKLSNPKANPDPTKPGATDLNIDLVVKDHDFLKGKTKIVLPRYYPIENEPNAAFVVFCDFYKSELDPYRGIPAKDAGLAKYMQGAITAQQKDVATRLRFFFDYLDSAELEVSTDAYKEFAAADHKEVLELVKAGNGAAIRGKLVQWLEDKDTPTYRYGLYGYLLGLCGTPAEADVLLHLLDDPQKKFIPGIDGVLAGYVSLKPKEGWDYLLNQLKDAKGDFTRRYAALRALRFLWDYRSELIPQKDLLAGYEALLQQGDIADLAVDDLRHRQQWQLCEHVLALANKTTHKVPIVQRSLIKYALLCPGEKAAAFVKEQRQVDKDRVNDVEELLKYEKPLVGQAATQVEPNKQVDAQKK